MRALLFLLLCAALAAGEPEVVLPPGDRLQAQALAYAEAQVAGRDGTYTFKVVAPPALPPYAKGDLVFEAAHLSRAEPSGRFYASFNAFAGGRPIGMVRVDMEGTWSGKLLRFRTAMPRKAVPDAGQLESFEFEGTPQAGALHEMPDGFRLRLPVIQGHILLKADLEPIPLVLMGEPVRLEVVDGDLSVTVDATARSSGAQGEKVRLEMPTSHKMLMALVTGPGEARVQWGGAK